MPELPQQQSPKPPPKWPDLPPCRPFEPRRCAVTPRAHEFVSEVATVRGNLAAYYRWARADWSTADKLALGAAQEAILCDLALLLINAEPGGPKYLTVDVGEVAWMQSNAPAHPLALFPDALWHLAGCWLIDVNSHSYQPGCSGELGFKARGEFGATVARLGLQADDFGCADWVSPMRRNVVRLP